MARTALAVTWTRFRLNTLLLAIRGCKCPGLVCKNGVTWSLRDRLILLIALVVTMPLLFVLVMGFTLIRQLVLVSICALRLIIIMAPLLLIRLCTMFIKLLIPVGRKLTEGLLSIQSMFADWPCIMWVSRMCRCLFAESAVLV